MESSSNEYHAFVPPPGHPRIHGLDTADPYLYSKVILANETVKPVFDTWEKGLHEPFFGITSNGQKIADLYELRDEGNPTFEMVAAAQRLIESFTSIEREKATAQLDSEQWRKWSNPEIIIHEIGIRLEHLSQPKIGLVMNLLEASMSPDGYQKAKGAMETNAFLGQLCNARPILNKHSYFITLFGIPSATQPWAYSFFGHHLCLNFFICGRQLTLSPFFIGAEPNIIDRGPLCGLQILTKEADLGLALMQSLAPELQAQAQIYKQMLDPAMPEGRCNTADERHLAGAFQDNRIIPYEGVSASAMLPYQQRKLLEIVSAYYTLLPQGPFEARLEHIRQHLKETYFSWIGGFGDQDAFYFRIQSPVVLLEFDHHCGVFLLNKKPAKYHIHTIARTPNGNDYGRELLRLYRKQKVVESL